MSEIKTISGDIVTYGGDNSITDVKSLTVDLEPIQDLHGYDKPWVGGAGKNKLHNQGTSGTVAGVTYTVNSDGSVNTSGTSTGWNGFSLGSQTLPAGTYILSSGVSTTHDYYKFLSASINGTTYETKNGDVTFTLTGQTTFTVNLLTRPSYAQAVKVYPMIRLASETDATFAPYENICPISGRTEIVTHRTGKNLLNLDRALGTPNPSAGSNTTSPRVMDTEHYYVGLRHDNYYYPSNVAEYSVANNEVTVRGTNNAYGVGFPIEVEPNTQYEVSATVEGRGYLGVSYYDANWGYISYFNDAYTFTTPTNASYAVILLRSLSTSATATWKNVQVELGTTATDYEPYQGTTYTTALGRTVYGGTLDLVSGKLVVDRAYTELSEDWSWSKSSSYPGGYYADMKSSLGYKAYSALISSHAKTARVISEYVMGTCYCDNSFNFRIMSETSTLQEWKDYIVAQRSNGTPITICYELATPQTYQLTPQQIEALFGVNNLWSSGGEVTLSYTENVLMPESVSINGKYLEAIIDGYLTLGTSGRRSLGRELDTYSVGSADGETVKGDRFPSRKITVNYVIQSDSEEELINSVNQLNNILNQDEADFVFRDESDKFFTGLALLDAEPKKYRHAVKGTWTLYCAYPFKRSVEPITLVSTKDASISGNSATFVFDYNGTRPARPVLRARFASAKSGGDYTEDGDCGFVAFVDGDEHIIQLGNPDVIDVDAANKNASLVNSELDAFTGWTNSGKSITSITDQFWENGKGQTQNYASGNGSIRRNIASTIGFEYDMVHRLCVSDPSQIGTFKVLLKNGNKTVVGFSIEKTGSGTGGTVKYIINDKTVGTDNIDLSYYNPHFGYCNRSPVYAAETYYTQVVTCVKKKKKKKKKKVVSWVANTRWVQNGWNYTQSNLNSGISRDGGVVTFSIGELADRTFKSSDIDTMACTSLSIESTGSFNTNAVRSVALIQKAGVPFAEIPNVFTSGDVVEGDCNSANVYLHRKGSTIGHLEPQYGALGNDWEDFELKPGRNAIRAVWSNWVNANYKPVIEITYNEVFL